MYRLLPTSNTPHMPLQRTQLFFYSRRATSLLLLRNIFAAPMSAFIKRFKLKLASLLLLLKLPMGVSAQVSSGNFDMEINYYKSVDSSGNFPSHPILFVGSSSIKNWVNLDSSFQGYDIINRGFGGSTLLDQIHYAPDIIFPHSPKQIVIYCGENDFASSGTISAETVFKRFTDFYSLLRTQYPEIPIIYISMKPSPSKINMLGKIAAYNTMVCDFMSSQKNTFFVDIYPLMLDPDGKPNRTFFYDDMLHMNPTGYTVWNNALRPFLMK